MIGVHLPADQHAVAQEFFQLFKTPWRALSSDNAGECEVWITQGAPSYPGSPALHLILPEDLPPLAQPATITWDGREIPLYAGLRAIAEQLGVILPIRDHAVFGGLQVRNRQTTEILLGYNLFAEIAYLLSHGQPTRNASIPTLERHIELLRQWMLDAGVAVVEIPPRPEHFDYMVCLTHDVDFVAIRQHIFTPALLGFLYRATVGTWRRVLSGHRTLHDAWRNLLAVFSLPLVAAGLIQDYWLQFPRYLSLQRETKGTFYIVPFKNQPGAGVTLPHPERRATRYDIDDIAEWMRKLTANGFEIGVHGLDGWHDAQAGCRERERIQQYTGETSIGIRTHWLCADETSYQNFEAAGYNYDSTCGYNDAIGFKAGTTQVFKPLDVKQLLELPMHIQDVAMFYPVYLNWTPAQAEAHCDHVFAQARHHGGVITLLWHHRSLGPERLWDGFYQKLLAKLRQDRAWFATARDIVHWFRARREIEFTRVEPKSGTISVHCPDHALPPPILRVTFPAANGQAARQTDFSLTPGQQEFHFEQPLTQHSTHHGSPA